MNKLFLCFVITLFSLFYSCSSYKKVTVVTDSKYVSFDKVKLNFKRQSVGLKSKGYIRLTKDSIITFKFWGPLGIELVKGEYLSSLNIFSYFENKEVNNVEFLLLQKYRVRLNRQCFEFLLLGDKQKFMNEFGRLNEKDEYLKMVLNDNTIHIANDNLGTSIDITFKMNGLIPKQISIYMKDNNDNVHIEVIFVSIHYIG